MAAKKVFSVGTLTINSEAVGVLQDVSLDISEALVPLVGANRYPEAMAIGQCSIKGTAKTGEFNSTLISTLTQTAMGVSTGIALSWVVNTTDGKTITFALGAVHITSYKISAGGDKWLVTDIAFEASNASGTVMSVTVST